MKQHPPPPRMLAAKLKTTADGMKTTGKRRGKMMAVAVLVVALTLMVALLATVATRGGQWADGKLVLATGKRSAIGIGKRSAIYLRDSARTLGRAQELSDQGQDRQAIAYIDSALSPEMGGTPPEALLLIYRAIQYHMVGYNILMDFEGGYQHLDSIERLNLPLMQVCLRPLYVAKAQMLMPLQRHREALEYLDRAMGHDTTYMHLLPDQEAYWLAADSLSIRHQHKRGQLQTAETLSHAFMALGMHAQALHYCSLGTSYSITQRVENNLVGRFFLTQAEIYNDMNNRQACLRSLASADSCFSITADEYFKMTTAIERGHQHTLCPDSLNRGLAMLHQLRDKVRQLASANIRFLSQKKEQENKLLGTEVELSQSRLKAAGLICIGLALALLAGLVIGLLNRRANYMRRTLERQEKAAAKLAMKQKEEQLRQLINTRRELYEYNQRLFNKLSEIQLTHHDTNCLLGSVMQSLRFSLLTPDEVDDFRASFSTAFPMVLNYLRKFIPTLTRTEELYIMLVVMSLNTEEVAHTLGIARKSVTKLRYRLRNKINLPPGTNMNIWIRNLPKVNGYTKWGEEELYEGEEMKERVKKWRG